MNITFKKKINNIFTKVTHKNENTTSCGNCDDMRKFYEDILSDPAKIWLYQNRAERMDASIELFNSLRRRFHLARYEFACNFSHNKVVADIACGTGYGSNMLRMDGKSKKVYGVDICPEAVNYAMTHHFSDEIEYICSSGDESGLGNETIDLVVSFETIEHVPNDHDLIREFHRILKPEGVMLCSIPNEWPTDIATHHVREYTRSSFVSLLTNLFEVDKLYNQNSGGASLFNRDQDAGITETTDNNFMLAECFIAVCKKK